MSIPATMVKTPAATITVAEGISTDASSEFWQRVAGNVFIVYENVPYALGQNILQSKDPDTAIKSQLSAYPKRVAAV
jgi:ABC-type sulfate transport system substrate-binding protein